jgi:phage terminase small subunit
LIFAIRSIIIEITRFDLRDHIRRCAFSTNKFNTSLQDWGLFLWVNDMALTEKQRRFCDEYLIDLNASDAARRAGYSQKTSKESAAQLLTNINVQAYITSKIKIRSERVNITQDYVLSTIAATIERCRQAEPVRDSEGNEIGEYKFDAGAVLKGCELLGKHLAMWTEKQQVRHSLTFEDMAKAMSRHE